MLRLLGSAEVNSILREQGKIDVNCDFCNRHYVFDKVDASALFANEAALISSQSRH